MSVVPPDILASLGDAAVMCRGVTKTYKSGPLALGPIDLNVRTGEFLSLLGPSGCGKSTLLRMIAGLEQLTTGTVNLSGRTLAAPIGQRIGFVFQEPTLMPWASVRDNIHLPLRLTRCDAAEAAALVNDALTSVGLAEFADAFPRELSGGMKMRVSLARAVVTDPDILLMDEPFAALDEITRFQLNDDLIALWGRLRKTVIFVTHSVFEAVYLSQRVVVMSPRPGRIASDIAVDPSRRRDAAFRTSTAYAELCQTVSAALASAASTSTRSI